MKSAYPCCRRSVIAGVLIGAFCAAPAGAANLEKEVAELRAMLEEASKQLATQRSELAAQQREIEVQRRILETLQAAQRTAARRETAHAAAEKPAPSVAQPTGPVGRAPEPEPSKPPQTAALTEMNSVLTPRNTLILEPSLQYAHSTNNRVDIFGYTILPALTLGLIDIRSVNRDTFSPALTLRYGLSNRLEVEAKLPYVWSFDATASRPLGTGSSIDKVTKTRGNGIGDIELAARYQLNDGGGSGGGPYYIGNLRVKTRTGKGPFEVATDPNGLMLELPSGSGFWAVQPSLTAIFPSDPAVFFGNVSYLWNVKRNVGAFGEVDPGDALGFNFGMGLALNEKASFSLGYDHSIIGRTKVGGAYQAASMTTHVGSLAFGYSYRLGERTSLNLSLAVGVTEAAPDMQLTLRLPMSF